MKVKQFTNLLKQHPNKALVFEYNPNLFVGANYHLTEIKKVYFDTVDCGGNPNEWDETQMQIWESPREIKKSNYITTDKVLSIFQKVDGIKLLNHDTELKVEFGNSSFHTSVMKIKNYYLKSNQLIIQLFEEKTLCKASSELLKNKQTSTCCTSPGCS